MPRIQALPCMTAGFRVMRVKCGISVYSGLGLDIADVVRERVGVHRPIAEARSTGAVVGPGERVLHPVDIVAFGKVLARMRAAALLACERPIDRNRRLLDEVVELE